MKLPLKYRIFHLLHTPKEAITVSELLNLPEHIVQVHINKLLTDELIKIVSTTISHTGRYKYTYEAIYNTRYGVCSKCNNAYDEQFLIGFVCPNCIELDELDYGNFGTSHTQIQHMQRIINDQKRVIYNLQKELYILKKHEHNL